MADTVDDFMRRFGGNDTVDDRDAERYHERFVSKRDDDRDFDNGAYHEGATEYLGKLPDDQFRSAVQSGLRNAPREERGGLLSSILGGLGGSSLARTLGLDTDDPDRMSDEDASRVIDYARRERPEVLRRTVEEKPWFVKAMGNPVVMGALTMAATRMLQNRNRGGGGLF